jgi:hypothetical protein
LDSAQPAPSDKSVSFQKARAMSYRKASLRFRFGLFAAVLWLSAAPAFAQDALHITLKLSPALVEEIERLIDLDLCSQERGSPTPQAAFWDLQTTISKALEADPTALQAVHAVRGAGQ